MSAQEQSRENSAILWSFRRCPYAMRARIGILQSGIKVELREILLRAKPEEFLVTSLSGTVPALKSNELILDESLDIMLWALEQNDPDGWLEMPDAAWQLIEQNDGPFKSALDHTKYSVRFPELNAEEERAKASQFLSDLEQLLQGQKWLFGNKAKLADYAILPFIRQFANTDKNWFGEQNWPNLQNWLEGFIEGDLFASIMTKYEPWQKGDAPISFP